MILEYLMEEGLDLKYIFKVHKNKDVLVESKALARETCASVFVSACKILGYEYKIKIYDGDIFDIASLSIKAAHTPAI